MVILAFIGYYNKHDPRSAFLWHGRRCFHCFSVEFFAEKTPRHKISTDADFMRPFTK